MLYSTILTILGTVCATTQVSPTLQLVQCNVVGACTAADYRGDWTVTPSNPQFQTRCKPLLYSVAFGEKGQLKFTV